MAEMLVRTVDKRPLIDPDAEARSSQRGDVITIQEDGWEWSVAERTWDEWMVVRVPGASVSELAGFMAVEDGDPALKPFLRRREFRFDLDGYGGEDLSGPQARGRMRRKPPVVDPAVIGGNPRIIG